MITAKEAKETAKLAREKHIKNSIVEAIYDGYDTIIFEDKRFFDDIKNLKPELETLGYKVIRKNKENVLYGTEYEVIQVSWE